MKNLFKNCISIIIAITIVLSSALVGLNEVDFNEAFAINAEAVSVSDLCFILNNDGKSYSVSSCSEYASGELVIPDTYNGLPVTNINNSVFDSNWEITSVIIPDSITKIGESVFWNCLGLISVTIPDSVTVIDNGAFYGCNNLKYVFYEGTEEEWENIYIEVFNHRLLQAKRHYNSSDHTMCDGVCLVCGCSLWNYEVYDECVTIKGYSEDVSELVIPAYLGGMPVTSIGNFAFKDCENLTSIIIPSGVKSIGEGAFSNCNSLGLVTIPETVTSIGDYAFRFCESLTSIAIPNGVTSIGDYAFCATNLTVVTIPESVEHIGLSAFDIGSSLTAINVSENNSNYTSVDGVLFDKDKTTIINYPLGKMSTSYIIPDSVTNILPYAFSGCTSLTSVTIPNSVKSIGEGAFAGCTGLSSIVIPDRVVSIGMEAFLGCTNLEFISLPDGIDSIGYTAFYNTAYYNDLSNWENGVLYINNHLISACEFNENSGEFYGVLEGTYVVKSGTKTIADAAFVNSRHLESVVLPDGVTYIGTWAFYGCKSLSSISIPDSLDSIDYDAFWGCSVLTDVYYYGSNAQWLKISIGYGNENLTNANIHIAKIVKTEKPKLKTISNTEYGVKITWSKVFCADKYRVYRKTSKGDWKYLGTTSKTGYTDKTAKSGKKYYYAIKARNDAGNSSLSSSLSKYYLSDPTLSTPKSTKSGVTLKWSKVSGAEGYIIYRKTGSGSYTKLKTEKGVSNLSYTDKSAKKGKKYTYKVKAYYSKTYSAYSNTKTITDKY